ncbi:hypothetical protein [Exiguobacterium sp. s157]|uniref:hypothetical protein n=1 Tax=Exiguobacterium TaxID=33986 RepID=UPI001BE66478|nr:hypothetical protein [Exiguobacterium sp. s157]
MQKNIEELVQLKGEDSYFRPFVVESPDSKGNVFIVGINPATPMEVTDFEDTNEYIDLIYNRSQFMERMQKLRIRDGKSRLSKTRVGLNAFVKDLEAKSSGVINVVETNMNALPTKSAKCLSLPKNKQAAVYGAQIFKKVFFHYKPSVVIVHSKQALGELMALLETEKLNPSVTFNPKVRLVDWISAGPITFTYEDGTSGTIFCSKHFMYHGHAGQSFQPLKEQVLAVFKQ